jgi:hypothetical protein
VIGREEDGQLAREVFRVYVGSDPVSPEAKAGFPALFPRLLSQQVGSSG